MYQDNQDAHTTIAWESNNGRSLKTGKWLHLQQMNLENKLSWSFYRSKLIDSMNSVHMYMKFSYKVLVCCLIKRKWPSKWWFSCAYAHVGSLVYVWILKLLCRGLCVDINKSNIVLCFARAHLLLWNLLTPVATHGHSTSYRLIRLNRFVSWLNYDLWN